MRRLSYLIAGVPPQVSLLRKIRALQVKEGPDAEAAVAALRQPLHLTINGIATAMRSTG